jgi:uncharacterized protein YdeI (BOF family)
MRKHTRIFWVLAALTLLLEVGSLSYLQAQQTPVGSQSQEPAAQQPSQPSQTSPSQEQPSGQQMPGSQTDQPQSNVQTFSGTIVKSGDKYVLQDAASGKTYDIDHQDIVGQHAGRKVRVTGTLDSDGKTIHLQPSGH